MAATINHRVGGWLPQDPRVTKDWLDKKIAQDDTDPKDWKQVIKDFQQLIEGDAEIFMGFHQMFQQVPLKPPYNNDPAGKPQVRDYMVMLGLFNLIIGEAPAFQSNDGFVGFPINAILDWPMGTTAGVATFFIPKVNAQFKKMFDVWASFLKSSDSCTVLSTTDGGWFSPAALEGMPDFQKTFVCDPSRPHWGFTSWDNFFTRLFQPNVRPVYFSNDNSIVNSGCESTVYRIQYNIQERDRFWLKGQPYSLAFMLDNHHSTSKFVNGTVYQAFLSAFNYHRWHSPVNGTIKDVVSVPGTYYVESPAEGFRNPSGPDPAADDLSQSFITSVATRALIFIEADNPEIGLMCFMAVGMAEVSTCEITVKPNDVVKKGDPLGMFHFGGSTHCLIFRPETNITFTPDVGDPVQLNTAVATVGR